MRWLVVLFVLTFVVSAHAATTFEGESFTVDAGGAVSPATMDVGGLVKFHSSGDGGWNLMWSGGTSFSVFAVSADGSSYDDWLTNFTWDGSGSDAVDVEGYGTITIGGPGALDVVVTDTSLNGVTNATFIYCTFFLIGVLIYLHSVRPVFLAWRR